MGTHERGLERDVSLVAKQLHSSGRSRYFESMRSVRCILPAVARFVFVIVVIGISAGCGARSTTNLPTGLSVDASTPPPDPPPSPAYAPRAKGALAFTKDVAPIVHRKCAGCHHAGEIGPFPLVSLADFRKRPKQVVNVIERRLMPPWPPAAGYCRFEGDQSLTTDEIGIISQWAAEGCQEGHPSDLPPLPEFPQGWKLGTPDLVLTMSEPYLLSANGKDIYRKFVLPVPITERKYVRAYEFDPGNRKIVHHAMIRIDSTGWSRYLDKQDPQPGFEGTMMGGDRSPDGLLMGWSPGATAPRANGAIAWPLEPGTDFVLELHLLPSGKPEKIQSSLALYFTPNPPDTHPCLVQLNNGTIDIPAGRKSYVTEDQYVLPIDAKIIECWPHAHFLCRDVQCYAVLPDGNRQWLLRIKDWNFNWQNFYTYAEPLSLPRGTTLRMRLEYDNSAGNPRNPHNPPRRVHFGRTSDDEMGEITFELLARTEFDASVLRDDFGRKDNQAWITVYQNQLKWRENDWESHYNLGLLYRDRDDIPQALDHYQEAIRLKPDSTWARTNLGTIFLGMGRLDDAAGQYSKALSIDPADSKAHNNLGLVLAQQGKLDAAAIQFEEALRANARFPEAETNFGLIFERRGDRKQAALHFERALELNPDYEEARVHLAQIRASQTPNN
jgi:tetratricopeptide (TPR) repeat protein